MPKSVFSNEYRHFLAVLIERRKASGMNLSEPAARFGKSQSWFSKVERGVRRLDVIELIAAGSARRGSR